MSSTDPFKSERTLCRMLAFLKPVRTTAIVSLSLLIGYTSLEIAGVYLLSPLITEVSKTLTPVRNLTFIAWMTSSEASAVYLRNVLIWMLAAQIGRGIVAYLSSLWETRLHMKIVANIRAVMYDHLQHMAFSHYDKMSSGKLINRALRDVEAVHAFLGSGLMSIMDILISISGYLGLLAFRSPFLVLTALAPVPIWVLLVFKLGRAGRPLYHAQHLAWDDLMAKVTETTAGKHVIKAFGTEEIETKRYQGLSDNFLNKIAAVIRFQSRLSPSMRFFANSAHITIFTVCAYLIHGGVLPVGDLMILGAAMATILGKLERVNQLSESYQKAIVSGRRVFEILDAGPSSTTAIGPTLEVNEGVINFENVVFGYEDNRPVIKGVTCEIPQDSVTAIIGPTGSGKSTLVSLITRFYDPQQGEIRIDGRRIDQVNLRELRRQVGIVFQESYLFTDSIRNNIRYGRRDVSDEMLQAAARAAFAEEFIESLPKGYDTPIGEDGVQLSGGQRQRLALARALVYDPKILILDDTTSALDATTEFEIRQRLKYVFVGRTVLFITHRVTSLSLADHVLVMENGQIVEEGAPEVLAKKNGPYRRNVGELEKPAPQEPVFDESIA